jgi:hypothetical protein
VTIVNSLTRTTPTYYSVNGTTLTYLSGATLNYVLSDSTGAGFQIPQTTAADEFPVANGPTHVSIINSENVTLHDNRSIPGELRLIDGKLILGDANMTIPENASILYANEDRYIVTNSSGTLIRENLGTTPFLFPIGPDTDSYDPVTIQNNGTVDTYSARVQSWLTYAPYDATRIVERQWSLGEATSGGSNLSASFRWDHTEQAANFDPAGTVLLLRSVAGAWGQLYPSTVSGSGAFTASSSGITDLTDFILSNDSFLPVELTAFYGAAATGGIHLDWRTASELNNAGFELYRRSEHTGWKKIAFITGYGTTSEQHDYGWFDTLSDLPVIPEIIQYKLRQIDIEGTLNETKPISVKTGDAQTIGKPQIYPSPCIDQATISFELKHPGNVTVEVFDASGNLRMTLADGYTAGAGAHRIRFMRGPLPPGIYFCRIATTLESHTIKFFIIS